jgi:hypothetical protein
MEVMVVLVVVQVIHKTIILEGLVILHLYLPHRVF